MTQSENLQTAVRQPAQRPQMPKEYGIATGEEHMREWQEVVGELELAHNYWLSTSSPDGKPHAMPVWGIWHSDHFYFSTHRHSRKSRNLKANSRVVVHLESGANAVIVEGVAEEITDPEFLRRLGDIYALKYSGMRLSSDPTSSDAVFAVKPLVIYAWLEANFSKSATCWRFE
ncbi:MAG TPA: pyridoxamine 5'-phosphate oxidase family protein [Chloroflexia bacterium]|nr:pyridoxamine 5'-phosphate oxidase family protein [Chloroflexia bacterium]